MTTEKYITDKSHMEYTGNKLHIVIPSKKSPFLFLVMVFWLVGWALVELTTIRALLTEQLPTELTFFLYFWLTFWTVGGLFSALILLWLIAGKETIIISKDLLLVERRIFGIGITKRYILKEAKNFRISDIADQLHPYETVLEWWGLGGGMISFESGMKTIKFASNIDKTESKKLIEEMKRYSFISN